MGYGMRKKSLTSGMIFAVFWDTYITDARHTSDYIKSQVSLPDS
jgi:hypothetical protein